METENLSSLSYAAAEEHLNVSFGLGTTQTYLPCSPRNPGGTSENKAGQHFPESITLTTVKHPILAKSEQNQNNHPSTRQTHPDPAHRFALILLMVRGPAFLFVSNKPA